MVPKSEDRFSGLNKQAEDTNSNKNVTTKNSFYNNTKKTKWSMPAYSFTSIRFLNTAIQPVLSLTIKLDDNN